MIELHIKICPGSCYISDYRDYEKMLLALLLKVNAFRNAITSYDNANASEVINCDHIEIEQSTLRILKFMLCENPNCDNAISHEF